MDPTQLQAAFKTDSLRFSRLVHPAQEPLVVFLKGHLLIEEQIALIINASVADISPLRDARFSFSQRVRLAKSLAGKFFAKDVYESIQRINSIRNKLAHEAEPEGFDELLAEFLEWCFRQKRFKEAKSASPKFRLHSVIGMIWAYLTGVRDVMGIVREKIPLPHHADNK